MAFAVVCGILLSKQFRIWERTYERLNVLGIIDIIGGTKDVRCEGKQGI